LSEGTQLPDGADYMKKKVFAHKSVHNAIPTSVLTLDDFGGRSDALGG
jgi:hypothetical protein